MRSRKKYFILFGLLTLAAAIAGGFSCYAHWVYIEHRFSTITENEVYQSGFLPPDALAGKIRKHGIRTVIDLRKGTAEADAERSVLEPMGVDYYHIPSSQVPDEATLRSFLEIMDRRDNRPVLIHCNHGTGRSVLFAAIYRIEYEGFSNEQALRLTRPFPCMGSFGPDKGKGAFLRNYAPRGRSEMR